VQRAYERLQAGAAGGQGPQPWRLLLLLRAQCILYRRYAPALQQYKYAGYPLLLAAVELPAGEGAAHFLSPEVVPRLQAAHAQTRRVPGTRKDRAGLCQYAGDRRGRPLCG
jgi:DnaJ family protein C protein 13